MAVVTPHDCLLVFRGVSTGCRLFKTAYTPHDVIFLLYCSCLVDVWGRNPWLSPIEHSQLFL